MGPAISTNPKRVGRWAAIGLVVLAGGCATQPAPGSLASLQQSQSRALALRCYSAHEGERMLFGAAEVWRACDDWARRVVRRPGPHE